MSKVFDYSIDKIDLDDPFFGQSAAAGFLKNLVFSQADGKIEIYESATSLHGNYDFLIHIGGRCNAFVVDARINSGPKIVPHAIRLLEYFAYLQMCKVKQITPDTSSLKTKNVDVIELHNYISINYYETYKKLLNLANIEKTAIESARNIAFVKPFDSDWRANQDWDRQTLISIEQSLYFLNLSDTYAILRQEIPDDIVDQYQRKELKIDEKVLKCYSKSWIAHSKPYRDILNRITSKSIKQGVF